MQGAAARAGRDPRLAQLVDRAAVVEDPLERAQLLVDRGERADLRLDEIGAVAAEAAHVEHQPADVAKRQLAGAAQEAQPAAQLAAVAEARGVGAGAARLLLDDDLGLRLGRARHEGSRGRAGGAGGRGLAPGQAVALRAPAKRAGRKSAEQAGAAAAS